MVKFVFNKQWFLYNHEEKKVDVADVVFLLIVIAFIVLTIEMISPLKSLPTYLYGGDLYNHLGTMNHIVEGGSFFQSGQMLNAEPWTPMLYQLLVVGYSGITGLDLINGVLQFSVFLAVLALFAAYFFCTLVFSNKWLGIAGAFLFSTLFIEYPILKYTKFGYAIIGPLFFLSFFMFLKNDSWKSALFLGIIYGVAGNTHGLQFIAYSFFLGLYALYKIFFQYVSFRKGFRFAKGLFKKHFMTNLKPLLIVFGVGIAIAMIYWYAPIFVYHGQTPNNLQEYGTVNISTFSNRLAHYYDLIVTTFFRLNNIEEILTTLLFCLGVVGAFLLKTKTKQSKELFSFVRLSLIISLIATGHHFITQPLLGRSFVPGYFQFFLFKPMFIIFVLMGVYVAVRLLKSWWRLIPMAILLTALVFTGIHGVTNMKNHELLKIGEEPVPAHLAEIAKWTKANTDVNTVFISDNEDSFVLNAFTGRKVITNRATHSSAYVDMDKRMMDTAVIFYGNNPHVVESLIQKYNVEYVFWEPRWMHNQYRFDEKGKLVGYYDPYLTDDNDFNRAYLTANGVNFTSQVMYRDPAFRSELANPEDLLIIFPDSFNVDRPWSDYFDSRLKQVYEVRSGNQVAARILKIK